MKHPRVKLALPVLAAVAALVAGPVASSTALEPSGPTETTETAEPAETTDPTETEPTDVEVATDRIFGTNRYETAIKISQASHPNPAEDFGGIVFIANGMNFPDALAAGPAATAQEGPILLVPPTGGLPANVRAEIERLEPAAAIILGRTDNVSQQVEDDLEAIITPEDDAAPVIRLDGRNRAHTSAMVAELVYFYVWENGSFDYLPPDTAYIANGLTYADALAGGAAGGWETAPLLLTNPGGLDASVRDFLTPVTDDGETIREFRTIRILGSVEAVSTTVENQIRQILPDAEIVRYPGRDRFDTARLLNADVFDQPGVEVTMTNGYNFPDALAGAPRVNLTGGPTVLVRPACVPVPTGLTLSVLEPVQITALGNTDQVSEAALGGAPCAS
ncbi:MAG: cell wall-binding repeat-containing protein [Actinomycetia bacterium]|nr:cell wall-binding repeat-containing protein [Actinomycetes bacterium]